MPPAEHRHNHLSVPAVFRRLVLKDHETRELTRFNGPGADPRAVAGLTAVAPAGMSSTFSPGWSTTFRSPPSDCALRPGERFPTLRPLADGLVGYDDRALREEIFDIPEAQTEAVVQPNGVADNLAW